MNTIAWLMAGSSGLRSVWALHDDVVLYFVDGPPLGEVKQYRPDLGRLEAERYIIDQTEKAEHEGEKMVGDPVEFDLSLDAMATIDGGESGHWIYAPLLRKELADAVGLTSVLAGGGLTVSSAAPPVVSVTTGAVTYNPTSTKLKVYNGSEWITIGTTNETRVTTTNWSALGIEMDPPD